MKHIVFGILAILAVTGSLTAEVTVNDELRRNTLYLLEEEKLARDLYTALGETWNLRVFERISEAEENHRSRVAALAEEYGWLYPDLPAGQFQDPEIQVLYDALIERGYENSREALEVGKLVEITDIADIDGLLAMEIPDDLRVVLSDLRRGSENHLAAFSRQLER